MLMLHAGAKPVTYEELRDVPTPPATETHVPIPHFRLVDGLRHTLAFYNHNVVEEHFGVTEDGMRFFGVLTLKSPYSDYADFLGCRSSNDKAWPVSVGYGSRVFICDNMAFSAETVLKRRHTKKALFELPSLLAQIIEPLAQQREAQHKQLVHFKETPLDDRLADHAVMQMYREGVINLQRIPEVLEQWDTPAHDWGDPTAYKLFNCATYVLRGRVAENPQSTQKLHQVIEGVCQTIH